MVCSEKHDILLCREVITTDPLTAIKKGTIQCSAKWEAIAEARCVGKGHRCPIPSGQKGREQGMSTKATFTF